MAKSLILIQKAGESASRTYYDFGDEGSAMDGLCGLYEEQLRGSRGGNQNITYSATELLRFIDGLKDIKFLSCPEESRSYSMHERSWIKKGIIDHLTAKAANSKESDEGV